MVPSEQIYSNRAASYLALKQYKNAVNDCKAAIRINSAFQRSYKRLFKAELAFGNVEAARAALSEAKKLDPSDATNKKDQELLDTVEH